MTWETVARLLGGTSLATGLQFSGLDRLSAGLIAIGVMLLTGTYRRDR